MSTYRDCACHDDDHDDEHRHRHHHHCCGHEHHHHHHDCDCGRHGSRDDDGDGKDGGQPSDGGTVVGWKNPNRPGHVCGTSTGDVPGGQVTPGTFDPTPTTQWPGPRNEMFMPYLLMRANAADLGARPVVGPFWESPDILLLAGADPAVAPAVPPALGQTAIAGRPNTIYAHVWNFGIAQAPNVIVEFYWCDPSLGIGPSGANLVGQTMVSLGARGSGHAHALVKCPKAWFPTFVNGGHECLVVRIWEETSDGLGTPPWDAALNRHVAQRNIHVIDTADHGGPGAMAVPDVLAPLTLRVGPLYGEPALVAVERVAPHTMPWLQQRTGVRGQFPAQAVPTGDVALGAPRTLGGGTNFAGAAAQHTVTADHQQVTFVTGDEPPPAGQAHVYRVTASQQGQVFGGYTVVLLGA